MTGAAAPPRAVLVVGPAGSGKSTVATALARRIGAAYLDKDAVCGAFVEALLRAYGADPHVRESSAVYLERVIDLEYRTLFAVAGDNLRLGGDVVLDAPFAGRLDDPGYLLRMRAGGGWPPATAVVALVRTPPETIRARLEARGEPRDAVKLAHWEEFWAAHGRPRCAWTDATVVEVPNDGEPDLGAVDRVIGARRGR